MRCPYSRGCRSSFLRSSPTSGPGDHDPTAVTATRPLTTCRLAAAHVNGRGSPDSTSSLRLALHLSLLHAPPAISLSVDSPGYPFATSPLPSVVIGTSLTGGLANTWSSRFGRERRA